MPYLITFSEGIISFLSPCMPPLLPVYLPFFAADTPLYIYCRSGSRSRQAVSILRGTGYTKAYNIGGIIGYRGEIIPEK